MGTRCFFIYLFFTQWFISPAYKGSAKLVYMQAYPMSYLLQNT